MSGIDATFISWFETRLIHAVDETNREYRPTMTVQVKGLADTVRQAKAAIDKANTVATRVNSSASQLVATMAAVEDMTTQLDGANADLQAALGTITNGGPPLETTSAGTSTSSSTASSPAAPAASPATVPPAVTPVTTTGTPAPDVHAARIQVEVANAANPTYAATIADKYIQKP